MPHSISIDHPVGCRGRLLQAHRREMEELVHDLRGDRLDGTPLALVQSPEHARSLRELLLADLLGARAQRGDRGNDLERRLPLVELLRLRGDDRLGPLGFAAPARERLRDDRLEVVDVVQVALVQIVDGRIEIAWHGQVDEQQLPAAAHAVDGLRIEDVARRARGRDDDVGARKLLLELCALGLAVRNERDACAPRAQVARRLLADRPCADEEDIAAVEAAEHLLRERGCGGRHGCGALADRGLRAHLSSRVQRVTEHAVEQRPRRAGVVRGAYLAEDLALARDERIEPRGDAAEMQCRRVVAQAVERGLELGEGFDRRALGGICIVCLDVQLGAVACRQAHGTAESLRERVRVVAVECDTLAQLVGSVVVRGADENELRHPKWVAGRASRTTMTSAKPVSARYAARRPDQPTARTPRYAAQTTHVTSVAMTSASTRSPRVTSRPMPTPMPSVSAGTDTTTVRTASRSSTASEGAGRRRIVVSRRFSRRSCQR